MGKGKKELLTGFYLNGSQGTGGNTGAAADAQFDGEQHRRFLHFFLHEKLAGAGSGGFADTLVAVAGHGIALCEVNIRVLVHIRCSYISIFRFLYINNYIVNIENCNKKCKNRMPKPGQFLGNVVGNPENTYSVKKHEVQKARQERSRGFRDRDRHLPVRASLPRFSAPQPPVAAGRGAPADRRAASPGHPLQLRLA